jgi:hypothetical protein
MQFIDDEFLVLSRGGRVSPGTNARLGKRQTTQQLARQELAERERAVRARSRRVGVRLRVRAAFGRRAAVRDKPPSGYRGKR